jgi:hypothetical protein
MRGRVAEATESKLVQFDRRASQLRRERFRRAKKIEGAATIDDAFSRLEQRHEIDLLV